MGIICTRNESQKGREWRGSCVFYLAANDAACMWVMVHAPVSLQACTWFYTGTIDQVITYDVNKTVVIHGWVSFDFDISQPYDIDAVSLLRQYVVCLPDRPAACVVAVNARSPVVVTVARPIPPY